MAFSIKNVGFDLVYTLNSEQFAVTTRFPNGIFYLRSNTDEVNLGKNTLLQYDHANVNVRNVGNQVVFENRFVPSTGLKELRIFFYVGYSDGNYSFPMSEFIPYQCSVLTPPFYRQNFYGNVPWNIVEKTSNFDMIYTLSPDQLAATSTLYPDGVFYLRSNTDAVNLGNNTLIQDDYANVNVTNVGNQLNFPNRFVPSMGLKELRIFFYVGYFAGDHSFSVSEIIPFQSMALPAPPAPSASSASAYRLNGSLYVSGNKRSLGIDIDVLIYTPNVSNLSGSITTIQCSQASVMVIAGGKLYSCGLNTRGQLGRVVTDSNPSSLLCQVPTAVVTGGSIPLNNVTHVATGGYGYTILVNNNILYSVGFNSSDGELGRPPYEPINNSSSTIEPVVVPSGMSIGTITKVTCGLYHTMVLAEGKLYCFGYNSSGQLGLGDTDSRQTLTYNDNPLLQNVTDVECVNETTYAISDNTLYRLETTVNVVKLYDSSGVEVTNPILTGISGGGSYEVSHIMVMVIAGGKLYSCGSNTHGQLGRVTTTNPETVFGEVTDFRSSTGDLVPNVMVEQVSCGLSHTLILAGGKLYSCGNNSYGRLGRDTAINASTVFGECNEFSHNGNIITLTNITKILASGNSSMVLNNNILYSFGDNTLGQLGIGNSVNALPITSVRNRLISRVDSFSLGGSHMAYIYNNTLYLGGSNTYGQLGNGTTGSFARTYANSLVNPRKVSCGEFHTMVLAGGKLYSCGNNSYGRLGRITTTPTLFGEVTVFRSSTGTLVTPTITDVFCGVYHTLVLAGGKLYSCGRNTNGQLGRVTTTNPETVFGEVTDFRSSTDDLVTPTITDISCGDLHTMVIAGGKLYSCGRNTDGQLGRSNTAFLREVTDFKSSTGDLVANPAVTGVSCGSYYSMVIAGGKLYSCGSTASNQLGRVTTTNASTVFGEVTEFRSSTGILVTPTVTEVSTGTFSVTVLAGNKLYSCGSNSNDQLGRDVSINSSSVLGEISVNSLTSLSSLSSSSNYYTCDLYSDSSGLIQCGSYNFLTNNGSLPLSNNTPYWIRVYQNKVVGGVTYTSEPSLPVSIGVFYTRPSITLDANAFISSMAVQTDPTGQSLKPSIDVSSAVYNSGDAITILVESKPTGSYAICYSYVYSSITNHKVDLLNTANSTTVDVRVSATSVMYPNNTSTWTQPLHRIASTFTSESMDYENPNVGSRFDHTLKKYTYKIYYTDDMVTNMYWEMNGLSGNVPVNVDNYFTVEFTPFTSRSASPNTMLIKAKYPYTRDDVTIGKISDLKVYFPPFIVPTTPTTGTIYPLSNAIQDLSVIDDEGVLYNKDSSLFTSTDGVYTYTIQSNGWLLSAKDSAGGVTEMMNGTFYTSLSQITHFSGTVKYYITGATFHDHNNAGVLRLSVSNIKSAFTYLNYINTDGNVITPTLTGSESIVTENILDTGLYLTIVNNCITETKIPAWIGGFFRNMRTNSSTNYTYNDIVLYKTFSGTFPLDILHYNTLKYIPTGFDNSSNGLFSTINGSGFHSYKNPNPMHTINMNTNYTISNYLI